MDVPAWASVQYPKGLGPLDAGLSSRFPKPFEKLTFSAAAVPELIDVLAESELSQVVVVGIESHICVLQTTLDLLARQYDVFVVADAIAARGAEDHQTAIQRMQAEGATITTTESVLFEWCQSAGHPEFKRVSAIIRET